MAEPRSRRGLGGVRGAARAGVRGDGLVAPSITRRLIDRYVARPLHARARLVVLAYASGLVVPRDDA
ncbi:hypothetical protein ACFU9F_07260 [Streptomyces zhihengii]|uniref:hypothetical protein n=1 Tax=Streptomyces zhihengii TaxID=1818004 RepID=UPI0036C54547